MYVWCTVRRWCCFLVLYVCLFGLFFNDVMENMVNLKGRIFKKKKLILNEITALCVWSLAHTLN